LSHCTFRRLRLTGWRLGAGGASTKFPAGDKRSISHKIFCGTIAPLAPNRLLAAGILAKVLSLSDCTQFSGQFPFPLHFRAALTFNVGCRFVLLVELYTIFRSVSVFRFIVGLHTFFKWVVVSVYSSNCTHFQVVHHSRQRFLRLPPLPYRLASQPFSAYALSFVNTALFVVIFALFVQHQRIFRH